MTDQSKLAFDTDWQYAPAPESTDHVQIAEQYELFINGEFVAPLAGKYFDSINPASEQVLRRVAGLMLQAIRDYYYATDRRVGMKPAGGISKAKQAVQYLVMLRETLGQEWLTPEWFRFGASSLANDLLMQIRKQQTGVYQSADYFSKD